VTGTTTGDVWTFTVEGQARNPIPESGATDVETDPNKILRLKWTPSPYAISHDVCIGTDCFNTPNPYLDVTIDMGRTYYWRVNEVNGATTIQGDVWTFTSSNYRLLDNFENYAVGSSFQNVVWYNTYGSCAGAAALSVVVGCGPHLGVKAMKIAYDPNGCYQAAWREFSGATGQNWNESACGAKALTLWLRGQAGNDVFRNLYIELGDSNGHYSEDVYYPDCNALLTSETWTAWNIDLTAFDKSGFDRSKVKELYIYLDDPLGGTNKAGNLYVDDIRLYPSRCVPDKSPANPSAVLSDITDDCVVNGKDLEVMAEDWLTDISVGDIYDDGNVDFKDFALLAKNWLYTIPNWP
jgi:hypothetical protein